MRYQILTLCFAMLVSLGIAEVADLEVPGALSARAWTDEISGDSVLVVRLPPPASTQEVRDQAAGFIEGPLHSGYFIPSTAGRSSFAGLPALFMRGRLVKDERDFTAIYTIAFASDSSYLVTAVSAHDPSSSAQEAEICKQVHPFDGADAIVAEIGPKLSDGIEEFAAMAERIVAAQRIKDKKGEPGATDNPDDAQHVRED